MDCAGCLESMDRFVWGGKGVVEGSGGDHTPQAT